MRKQGMYSFEHSKWSFELWVLRTGFSPFLSPLPSQCWTPFPQKEGSKKRKRKMEQHGKRKKRKDVNWK